MEALQPVLDLLKLKYGWAAGLAMWLPALSLVLRSFVIPFNNRIQATLTQSLADWAEQPEDATWVHDRILTKGWYRAGFYFMRLFTGIRLPTHADFHKLLTDRCAAAVSADPIKPAGQGDLSR